MFIACVIATAFVALASFGSAMGKLRGVEQMERLLDGIGMSPATIRALGYLQVAGAIGIVIGLWWPPIGIAAAAGLSLYYLGAMVAHARSGHPLSQVMFPFPLMAFSLAALVLRIVTI